MPRQKWPRGGDDTLRRAPRYTYRRGAMTYFASRRYKGRRANIHFNARRRRNEFRRQQLQDGMGNVARKRQVFYVAAKKVSDKQPALSTPFPSAAAVRWRRRRRYQPGDEAIMPSHHFRPLHADAACAARGYCFLRCLDNTMNTINADEQRRQNAMPRRPLRGVVTCVTLLCGAGRKEVATAARRCRRMPLFTTRAHVNWPVKVGRL